MEVVDSGDQYPNQAMAPYPFRFIPRTAVGKVKNPASIPPRIPSPKYMEKGATIPGSLVT